MADILVIWSKNVTILVSIFSIVVNVRRNLCRAYIMQLLSSSRLGFYLTNLNRDLAALTFFGYLSQNINNYFLFVHIFEQSAFCTSICSVLISIWKTLFTTLAYFFIYNRLWKKRSWIYYFSMKKGKTKIWFFFKWSLNIWN